MYGKKMKSKARTWVKVWQALGAELDLVETEAAFSLTALMSG